MSTAAIPADQLLRHLAEALAPLVAEHLDTGEPKAPTARPWLDVAGAAEYIACPKSRVYALTSAGRIPFRKDGSRLLFKPDELDAWLEAGGGKRP